VSAAKPEPDESLIVVGVGASAGGLEAFTDLVSHLPRTTGIAFILVQHLDPHHKSALPELVAGKTSIPVLQVQNGMRIEPDHIYVNPPNTLMLIRDRTLILEPRPETAERFRPIDAFFTSLAEGFHFQAVGVVLSGTASDGTLGLKAIKAEGGITFAQNQTAKFDSMPRSAIAAGVVDFILSPRRIAEELAAITHRTRTLNQSESGLIGDGNTLHRVLLLLRQSTGVDFAQYKQTTILRRLNRRMVVRRSEILEQYFDLLQKEPDEVKALFDDLLINVTDFFRDPGVFEAAKKVAFLSVIRQRKQPINIRAWIPGCSSGEEVYSMTIALVEFLESEGLEYTIQMFGTDVSDSAIDKARAGVYDESSVVNVSPERLRRFFVRTEAGYQISRTIRDMCIFSRHNVAKDPPLSRMDLVSCRNLLIYFAPSLQRRILATLAYALQPSGCLILGPSETLGSLAEYFQTLDEPHKIYCRKSNILQGAFHLAVTNEDEPSDHPTLAPPPRRAEALDLGGDLHKYVNRIVLSQFGPAGVVVNEDLQTVELRGDVVPYLSQTEPGDDLMKLVRRDMRSSLGTAIEQARRTNAVVVAESAPDAGSAPVAITVVPLALAGAAPHFLILFGGAHEEANGQGITADPVETATAASLAPDQENAQLKQELKSAREYLQSVIEELRSTNEEAQSANEELQSTNEELQTSKEELQSANEELHTINMEMHSRNADLAQMNDDMANLLSSMNTPIVMTGSDLRIRRFTPTAEKVLKIIATDVGRPIADLKPRINVPNLEEILQQVVDTLQPYEKEVQDQEGHLYLMRVRPYRTADNRIDGTVLQLLDVSELKGSLEEARHARDFAEAIVNTVREPLVVLDQNLKVQNANRAFYEALSLEPDSALGQTIYETGDGRFDLPEVRALFEHLAGRSPEVKDVEIVHRPERGEARTLLLNARRLRTTEQRGLILMAFEDITERKRAAEAPYRRLFETARDGIVLVNADTGEIVDINPFTERLLGYARNELVGRKLWEIEPMRGVPRLRPAFDQIRELGMVRFDELTLLTKDGHTLQAEVIANMYAEDHRPAMQFHIRDVGERRRFERELQETQKLESLGLLAGGIAHDFNNLLTGIIGNASIAYAELPVDQPVRACLREVMQAGERAAFLTRQMLAYAGQGRFVTGPVNVGDLVTEISPVLRTSIPKSVELKLNLAANLPLVEADSAQLQQMVMNLVVNGAEAIGENTPGRVEIRTSAREIDAREAVELFSAKPSAPGVFVQLEVSDTGSGMDEATKARIFDPFFTTKFTGRGLGLAAVQGIVKGHHGAIRVYSAPGQGTSFLVLLPAIHRQDRVSTPQRASAVSIPAGSVALVIDSEATIREFASGALSRAGMQVLVAENVKTGVEMLREHSGIISVVLLDPLMTVPVGEDALALLKEMKPAVPVILSSGFDEAEAARRFSEPKPAGFLRKPYTMERLVEAVAAVLNRS